MLEHGKSKDIRCLSKQSVRDEFVFHTETGLWKILRKAICYLVLPGVRAPAGRDGKCLS